jgi:hypothetical protein
MARQQSEAVLRRGEVGADRAAALPRPPAPAVRAVVQVRQAVAQGGQVARPRAAQCDAGGDALDVGQAAQRGLECGEGPVAGLAASSATASWRAAAAARSASGWCRQWRSQREPMLVRSRRAGKQGRRRLAAQGLGQLQVAPGGGVQAQPFALALEDQRGDVGQRLVLRGPGRTGRGRRRRPARRWRLGPGLGQEGGEVAGAEVQSQSARGGVAVEMPVGQAPDRRGGSRSGSLPARRRAAGFPPGAGARAGRPARRGRLPAGGSRRWRGSARPGRRGSLRGERQQQAVGRSSSRAESVSVPGVTMRVTARSTGPLRCRVADLLADHHRFAQLHQPRQVLLDAW